MKNLFLFPLLILSSCASIIEGGTQQVSLRTEPNKPASCEVEQNGKVTKVEAPTIITLARSYYPARITCVPKSAGRAGTAKVLSDVSNWGYGGAALGLGVGPAVDAGSGGAFEYPAEIVVKLGEDTTIGKTQFNENVEF